MGTIQAEEQAVKVTTMDVRARRAQGVTCYKKEG